MNKIGRKIAAWTLVAVVIVCYGLAFALWGRTLVDWWIPALICVGVALASGVSMHRLWRGLTGMDSAVFNYLCHAVTACAVAGVLFFGANSLFADTSTRHTERVAVASKYIKEGYHTRRIGRNHSVRGEKYYNYYLLLEFPDGRTKRISVSNKQYNRTRHGDSLSVELERGALGIPVIREMNRTPRKTGRRS